MVEKTEVDTKWKILLKVSFVVQEETDGYHQDGWTFADMQKELIAFASEYGIVIDAAQARALLSVSRTR